jgi:cyclohexyl-isocyanide hydratase
MVKLGILVFNGVEELDFVGPFETLSYINKILPGRVDVKIIAKELSLVKAYNGLRFMPNDTIYSDIAYDILIIPGGQGRHEAMFDKDILEFISNQFNNLNYLCSVCTGSFIVAQAIENISLNATTHYTALEEMAERYPHINVVSKRVVKNKTSPKIWFAAGISSGIDLSLDLIEELFSKEHREQIAKRLEYPPKN